MVNVASYDERNWVVGLSLSLTQATPPSHRQIATVSGSISVASYFLGYAI